MTSYTLHDSIRQRSRISLRLVVLVALSVLAFSLALLMRHNGAALAGDVPVPAAKDQPPAALSTASSGSVNTPATTISRPSADYAAPSSQTTTVESTTSTDSNGHTSTALTVNGQPVALPANGSVNQTLPGPDGQTTRINASSSQTSSGTNFSSSNISTYVDSSTTHLTQQTGGN